jgi:hypothetical protein
MNLGIIYKVGGQLLNLKIEKRQGCTLTVINLVYTRHHQVHWQKSKVDRGLSTVEIVLHTGKG